MAADEGRYVASRGVVHKGEVYINMDDLLLLLEGTGA